MRGAVFCIPASGHLNPLLPLVAELVRRGEKLDFYGTERTRAAIEATGARFVALSATEALERLDPDAGIFAFAETLASVTLELFPTLIAALDRDRPDYVLYDSMTPWGRLVARHRGVPAVATYPSFATLPEKSLLPPVPILLAAHGASALSANIRRFYRRKSAWERVRAQFGVEAPLRFASVISNPSECNIVFTAERFQVRRERLDERFHFVGASIAERPAQPDFPWAELDGKRVVYVSFGSLLRPDIPFFRSCVDAFAGKGVALVLTLGAHGKPEALGALPDGCIVRRRVPQLEMLKRAALFITHGGMNSVSESIAYRVPMLVAPQVSDAFLVAARVHDSGLGRRLRRRDFEPRRLRAAADAVMADERIRANLQSMSDSFRAAGGVPRAADVALAHVQSRPSVPADA